MTRLLFSGFIFSLFVSHTFYEQLTQNYSRNKFVSHYSANGIFDMPAVIKNDTTLNLDFIYPFPFKDGAGDFFTYDTTTIIPNKFPNRYIFISNLIDSAVIRIKGKVELINIVILYLGLLSPLGRLLQVCHISPLQGEPVCR